MMGTSSMSMRDCRLSNPFSVLRSRLWFLYPIHYKRIFLRVMCFLKKKMPDLILCHDASYQRSWYCIQHNLNSLAPPGTFAQLCQILLVDIFCLSGHIAVIQLGKASFRSGHFHWVSVTWGTVGWIEAAMFTTWRCQKGSHRDAT